MDTKEVAKQVEKVELTPMATPKSFYAKLPKSALDPALDGYYEKMRPSLENLKIKGFRPGKIPKDMLIRKMGGVNAFYEPLLAEVMKEIALSDGKEICSWSHLFLNEEGDNYVLSSVVFEFPKVKVPDDLSFLSEVVIEPVNKEHIEKAVESEMFRVRNVYTTYEDVITPAEVGDRVIVTCSAFCGKKTVRDYTGEYRVILGEKSQTWWDSHVRGKEPGFEATINFVETRENSPYFDKELVARVKVKAVQKVHVPDVDDRILEAVGFKTEDSWRIDLLQRFGDMMESAVKQRALKSCLDMLIGKSEIEPIPLSWIHMQVEMQLDKLSQEMPEQEAYRMYGVQDVEQLRGILRMQVYIDVKDDLILRELASRNEISTEEEAWQEKVFEKILGMTSIKSNEEEK